MALGIALQILPDRLRAEQLIEQVFWWLWKHPSLYQSRDGNFTDWLFSIVRQQAFTELDFGMTEPLPGTWEELERMLKQNPSASQDETWALTDSLTAEEIRVAFSGLPAKQRQVIGYAYYQGMTRHEIAERLGVSIDIVATWARLGLAQFGERIRHQGAARANVAQSGLMRAGGSAPESRTERMV